MIPELLLRAPAAYLKHAKKLQKISETILGNQTAALQTEISPRYFTNIEMTARVESLTQSIAKKALLEDQLGTMIQKIIVAKAPSCFITSYGRDFLG